MALGKRFIPNLIVFLLSFQCYYSSSTIEGRKLGRRFKVRINEVGGGSSLASLETVNVNVNNYGANGDGSTDATEAFKKAWKVACSSEGPVVLEMPKNSHYLLNSITFEGPCKSTITVKIHGTVQAPVDRSDYGNGVNRLLLFKDVDNLSVQGGGIINGNGKTWWQNSCKVHRALDCTDAPTDQAVQVQNVVYQNIRGTSSTKEAIKFVCSHNFPCREIMLQDIDLRGEEGKVARAECENAQVTQKGYVSPSCT